MTNTNLQVVPAVSDRGSQTQSSGVVHEPDGSAFAAMEGHPAWPMIRRLPVILGVGVPVRGLKVRHLLNLRCGQKIASAWPITEDVPLQTGALKVCWGEFEVAGKQIAIRLTRLA